MSQSGEQPVKNRRYIPRRKPRGPARVSCTTAPGKANLAWTLLDVARSGARLLLRSEVQRGQQVAIGLPWPGRPRRETVQATVVWCLPVSTGGFCVGVQFHRLLAETIVEQVLSSTEAGIPLSAPAGATSEAAPSA